MLDKLYFIFHCSVKSGFAHAERASFMLSTSIFVYLSSFYFCFLVLIKANVPNPWIMSIALGCLALAIIYASSKYFVRTGRYRWIIDKHGSPRSISKTTRFWYRFIAVFLFFFGSFTTFIVAGIMLSKHLHSW
jgi:hypothetical protein